MELQKLYSYVRQAIENYGMIREGDHIAVGISGGKDSLTLLYALAGLHSFYPKKFTLTGIKARRASGIRLTVKAAKARVKKRTPPLTGMESSSTNRLRQKQRSGRPSIKKCAIELKNAEREAVELETTKKRFKKKKENETYITVRTEHK